MAKVDLTRNFASIFHALEATGIKQTNFAKTIGFTSTTQLHNSLVGKSLLSTKAIVALIEELNVNPSYLFLGIGEMFLSDTGEDEITVLKAENERLTKEFRKAVDDVMTLGRNIHELEKMYSKLADVHAETLKYYSDKADKDKAEADKDNAVEKEELNKSI